MARQSKISYEQVATVINELKAAGEKYTTEIVRNRLGSGSLGTVLKYIQQYTDGQTRTSETIDDTIDPAVVKAISNSIAVKVQDAKSALTAAHAELQQNTAQVISENESQAEELELTQAELTSAKDKVQSLTGQIDQLITDITQIKTDSIIAIKSEQKRAEDAILKASQDILVERQTAQNAQQARARAELQIEQLPKLIADLDNVRAELVQTNKQAAADSIAAATALAAERQNAAVAVARLEAEQKVNTGIQTQLTDALKRIAVLEQSMQNELAESKIANEAAAVLKGQLKAVKPENKVI